MRIAIQSNAWLGTLHASDLSSVLHQVADAGFPAVEVGAHKLNLDAPEAFIALAEQYGLTIAGIHTHGEIYNPAAMRASQDTYEKVIRFARSVHAACVLISGKPKADKTEEELQAEVQSLHWVADLCQAQELPLYYHNHNWELKDNLRELRYLMMHTQPGKISLALDIGWVQRAGFNPLKLLEDFYPRIRYLHIKDTLDRRWTELGRGTVDFRTVFAYLQHKGYSGWLTVERDEELVNAFESSKFSRETLRGFGI